MSCTSTWNGCSGDQELPTLHRQTQKSNQCAGDDDENVRRTHRVHNSLDNLLAECSLTLLKPLTSQHKDKLILFSSVVSPQPP